MKRYITVLTIVLWTSVCFAQVSFKKGYFIDKQGNKTECFIKDLGWYYAPSSINYRLTESGDVQKMETTGLSEFAVGDVKYVRAKIQYDKSTQDLKKAGLDSKPDWTPADALLKVIVQGKATLYHHVTKEYSLFFFSVNGSPIEQLVYKSYFNPKEVTKLYENRTYLSQLQTSVNCDNVDTPDYKDVPYKMKPLTDYFKKYNRCSGDVVVEKEETKKKKTFSLRLTPGVDFASAATRYYKSVNKISKYEFGTHPMFRLGAEMQLALPFKQGKWVAIAEPTFVMYKGDDKADNQHLTYRLLELPVGIRYRFFLSEQNYFFVNAMVVGDLPLKQVQTSTTTANRSDVNKGTVGFTGGVGFNYGRFSVEGRYYPKRRRDAAGDIDGHFVVGYEYTKSTVILGIRIF